ncbi:MAG: hypothetical protein Q8R92_15725 [Deltaproteobacteria bacterium]|nr:hypothetical protein [Deltaproteobacteria bacterium]
MTRANLARLAGAVLLGGIAGPVLLLFGLSLTLAGSDGGPARDGRVYLLGSGQSPDGDDR